MYRIGYKLFWRDKTEGRMKRAIIKATDDAAAKTKGREMAKEMGVTSFGVDKVIEENLLLVHEEEVSGA